MRLKIYWKQPDFSAALLSCYTLGIHNKNRVGMRQCASNCSDMLISYCLYARNRSAEQARSAADTSNSQHPAHGPCFSLLSQQVSSESPAVLSVDATWQHNLQ